MVCIEDGKRLQREARDRAEARQQAPIEGALEAIGAVPPQINQVRGEEWRQYAGAFCRLVEDPQPSVILELLSNECRSLCRAVEGLDQEVGRALESILAFQSQLNRFKSLVRDRAHEMQMIRSPAAIRSIEDAAMNLVENLESKVEGLLRQAHRLEHLLIPEPVDAPDVQPPQSYGQDLWQSVKVTAAAAGVLFGIVILDGVYRRGGRILGF